MIHLCFNAWDPVGFFQMKLLLTLQTSQPASNADLFSGFEWLHFTPGPTYQWEFGLGKDFTKEAGRLQIFASAIDSHINLMWNGTFACRTFFILSIMNFLVSLGSFFAMLFSIWIWGVESSTWQTLILYRMFPGKWQRCLVKFLLIVNYLMSQVVVYT